MSPDPIRVTSQQLFGVHVRHHRVRQGLSHAELSARLALPLTVRLEEIEDGPGVGALDLGVALALAEFCGVPLGLMLGAPLPTRGTRT
jgi:hypothetical protein